MNVFIVAPGEGARLWQDCREGKYICVGWLDDVDLSAIPTPAELDQKYKETYKQEIGMNERASIWGFAKDMQVGDLILAKKGAQIIVGAGVVTSPYISPFSTRNKRTKGIPQDAGHLHNVNWIWSGEIAINGLPIKTLTQWGVKIQDGRLVEHNKDQAGRLKEFIDAAKLDLNELQNWSEKAMKDFIKEEIDQRSQEKKKLLENHKQIILHGPPGTGKTRQALEIAASVLGCESAQENSFQQLSGDRWTIVQFHPAYNYEDFVRGVRVVTDKDGNVTYSTENGIFSAMAQRAAVDPDNTYVLIIDEVNRANLASVLGELIYALEYRGKSIDTPYALANGGRSITVPGNLLIIGTMNTADRSIGHIDYAIRRRFAFVPCLPQASVLDSYYGDDAALKDKAASLFHRVAGLFVEDPRNDIDRKASESLCQDFAPDDVQLGHSYFLARTEEELDRKIKYQVKPILYEYVRDGVLRSDTLGVINSLAA